MKLINVEYDKLPIASLDASAKQLAENLILQSQEIKAVTDSTTQNSAVDAARAIRSHLAEVESTRVSLTKPLLEKQRLVKAIADDYCAPLLAEQKRVERMVTDFQQAERRRVEAEQKELAEKIAKAEAERIAAEQLAREAASGMASEADLKQALEAEALAKANAEAAQAIIRAPLPAANKAKGAATKRVMRYEVLDIAAVAKARPELVKMEIKAAAVLSTCVPELAVPGLKLWWEDVTSIRKF